jgi:hypothetical protein
MDMNESIVEKPIGNVLAVFNSEPDADRAIAELSGAGYQVAKLSGEDFSREIDPSGRHSGPLGWLWSQVEDHLSEQTDYLREYETLAWAGNKIVAVRVEHRDKLDEVTRMLAGHGGENIRHFGLLAVTDLAGATDPVTGSPQEPHSL